MIIKTGINSPHLSDARTPKNTSYLLMRLITIYWRSSAQVAETAIHNMHKA